MAKPTPEEITSKLMRELAPTSFACTSLVPLSGGTVNFLFKGRLLKPFEDGTTEVVIKHGEGYSASFTGLGLSTDRCVVEESTLKAAGHGLAPTVHRFHSGCTVRTPKLFPCDLPANTQVQEYLPRSLDLKRYVLKYFSASTLNPDIEKGQVLEIGQGLGKWLRSFHDWAATHDSLPGIAKSNVAMQSIKIRYNYELLLSRIDKFPSILSDAKPEFEAVLAMAKAELEAEANLQVIHGDFWTGNILLPDEQLTPGHHTPLFVVDWEMCQLWLPQLDLGQMIAELYELNLYKNIEASLWLIEGFVSGYGFVSDGFAFRTLIHVGTHLVGFGTGVADWGNPEQCETVAMAGRDIILRARRKDKAWFKQLGHLGCLFEVDA